MLKIITIFAVMCFLGSTVSSSASGKDQKEQAGAPKNPSLLTQALATRNRIDSAAAREIAIAEIQERKKKEVSGNSDSTSGTSASNTAPTHVKSLPKPLSPKGYGKTFHVGSPTEESDAPFLEE